MEPNRCEEMMSAVFQNWLDMILLVDADDGRILSANRAAFRILGYRPEELVGKEFTVLFPKPDKTEGSSWHERLRASDAVFEYQEFVHADGSLCPLDVMAVLLDLFGRKTILVNLRDASERARVEEALRRSEERYRQLTECLTDYIYRVRVEKNCPIETYHSEACVGVTGYAPEEFRTDPYLWINMVHEDDRDIVRRQAGGILSGRDVAGVIHRIVKKNGEIRWVSNTPVPCYDGEGNLLSYDGLVKDVTDRVLGEKEQSRLVAVIEQTDQGVMITDARGVVQYVNSAFEGMTGYCREEVIGRKPSILSSGCHTREFYRDLWVTISRGDTWSGQIICKKKDGSIHHVQTTISPMRDEKGRISNYVSVRRDITQDLLLQDQLRQAQKMEARWPGESRTTSTTFLPRFWDTPNCCWTRYPVRDPPPGISSRSSRPPTGQRILCTRFSPSAARSPRNSDPSRFIPWFWKPSSSFGPRFPPRSRSARTWMRTAARC